MPETVIEAGRTGRAYWSDVVRYRELLYFLAWRDVLVRYKQTVIGVAWAVLRPLLVMLILTYVFGRLAKMSGGETPYAILVLAGVLPWQFFAAALSDSSQSMIANGNLVAKIYFPRVLLPLSSVLVSLVDFAISLGLLAAVMWWFGYAPTWRIATLPAFLGLAMLAAVGPGLLIAAANVRYRDFRFVVPFAVQFGLYLSPVGFRTEVVPAEWRILYSLNPMVGVIDGFRWAICRGEPVHLPALLCSLAVAGALSAVGVAYFRRTERSFADLI